MPTRRPEAETAREKPRHQAPSRPRRTEFAIAPPIAPMLAKLTDELPAAGNLLFEPKWDGFRAIVFRGTSDVYIQSRDLRPLDRYFPELHDLLLQKLPAGCVIDGEIVIATSTGLDFDALQMRLHLARRLVVARFSPSVRTNRANESAKHNADRCSHDVSRLWRFFWTDGHGIT